jgi:colanic acid/amylovoran biosynthesis glycosyltransferase
MHRGEGELTLVTDRPVPAGPGLRPLGLLGRRALRAELARANLLVLPCRVGPDGDQDGVPLVIMEALAAGRPVLTTPVSGIPELVDAEVGWLCDPSDPAALATGLKEAEDPHQRRIRGERGPERLRQRRFTLAAQVISLDREWRACLASAACGSPKTRT